MKVPIQKSALYMFKWGAQLGFVLGAIAGIITAFLITIEPIGALVLGIMFGGAFGLGAGAIMGMVLGIAYGFAARWVYEKVDFSSFRMGLTLLGGVGAAAMATRVELLSQLLPEYAYIVIAGVAAGLASYRYAGWYRQQRNSKFKNKDASVTPSRLVDASPELKVSLSDDMLHYQDNQHSQR